PCSPDEVQKDQGKQQGDRRHNLGQAAKYTRQESNDRDKRLEKHGSADDAARQTAHIAIAPTPADPRLTTILDSWPTLPEALRAGILAMIEAARIDAPTSQSETCLNSG